MSGVHVTRQRRRLRRRSASASATTASAKPARRSRRRRRRPRRCSRGRRAGRSCGRTPRRRRCSRAAPVVSRTMPGEADLADGGLLRQLDLRACVAVACGHARAGNRRRRAHHLRALRSGTASTSGRWCRRRRWPAPRSMSNTKRSTSSSVHSSCVRSKSHVRPVTPANVGRRDVVADAGREARLVAQPGRGRVQAAQRRPADLVHAVRGPAAPSASPDSSCSVASQVGVEQLLAAVRDGPARRPRPGIRPPRRSGRRAARSAGTPVAPSGGTMSTRSGLPHESRARRRRRRDRAQRQRRGRERRSHSHVTASHRPSISVRSPLPFRSNSSTQQKPLSMQHCSSSARAHHLVRDVLAFGRRRRFLARAERHPVLGAGLAAPERAERGDAGALAARDADLAAASGNPSSGRPRRSGCRRWGRGWAADPRRPGRRSRRRRRCTSRRPSART